VERWDEAHTSDLDVYEALAAASDPEQRVWGRVRALVPFAGKTVLEIGCGPGRYAAAIAPLTAAYLALDVSEGMLAVARRRCAGLTNITFLQVDAQAIPLPDASVDLVFGTWAIGAIWSPEARARALMDIRRVVRRGGQIWAVENHWDGPFMEMRGEEEQEGDRRIWYWYEAHGFELVEVVDTAFAFPSLSEAVRVLGFIFGEKAIRYLERHPDPRLGHRAIILRKADAIPRSLSGPDRSRA